MKKLIKNIHFTTSTCNNFPPAIHSKYLSLITCMYVGVLLHIALLMESFAAIRTRIRPSVAVDQQMRGQRAGPLERLSTLFAFEHLFHIVNGTTCTNIAITHTLNPSSYTENSYIYIYKDKRQKGSYRCWLRLTSWPNVLLHNSQANGRFPLWLLRECTSRPCGVENIFSHFTHE